MAATVGLAVGAAVGTGFLVGLGLTVADGVEVGTDIDGDGDINITFMVDSLGSGEIKDLLRRINQYTPPPRSNKSINTPTIILVLLFDSSMSLYYRKMLIELQIYPV